MKAVLRAATCSDVGELVDLRQLMFEDMGAAASGTDWREPAVAWFARAMGDPSVCLVVVEENAELVSCGLAELHEGVPDPTCPTGRTVHLSNLVTRRDARGRGLAKQCMSHLLEWAVERADRVELHASADGESMYRRMGFREPSNPAMRVGLPRAP